MRRVIVYSLLLVAGMALSQLAFVQSVSAIIAILTMIFLSYIMIEVGMEFDIDKSNLRGYGVDYAIAMGAAAIPWLCAALYFWWLFGLGFKESLLVGRFASPTSAGILFTMLAAAGLAATWVYRKARVLAIFDDLDTVLLMISLEDDAQECFLGARWASVCCWLRWKLSPAEPARFAGSAAKHDD